MVAIQGKGLSDGGGFPQPHQKGKQVIVAVGPLGARK
jgi:hypothetical protein